MLHLRVIAPADLAGKLERLLCENRAITAIAKFPGAALEPIGDVWLCDVAREDASIVLSELRALALDREGTIAIQQIDATLSDAADAAEEAAEGSPTDAVVWESVEAATSSSADLTIGFALFMVLATMLGAVAILTDSVVLTIGAMVVGPEYGPLAGVCVAMVQRRGGLALRSLGALFVGFAVAIAVTWLGVAGLMALQLTPATLDRTHTLFVSHPDAYSVIVALIAGVAGMLSLSTSKSAALIGVFISVTTIPAAANMAVAAAYRDAEELRGATTQLAVNIACIVVAGVVTLGVQRLAFWRRTHQALRRRRRKRKQRRR